MLFNSYIFLLAFLPATLLLYYAIRRIVGVEASFILLCVASLVYYAYWKIAYLPILLISIFGNYYLGVILSRASATQQRKTLLVSGVLINLGALAYYKYANFFVENLEAVVGQNFDAPNIVLPLAISFFTFQQIAYLVDACRGEVKEYKFIHYFLFVTFFPQLIAGPIVHHKEMLPQFMQKAARLVDSRLFWLGMVQFSIGLFKKVVIADTLATFATPVFFAADMGTSLTMAEAWVGALAYTFQLYFDFSGYSDMALGIAKMFGINLPVNFNSPYKSQSITEFWRRWHMTLSRFLRDYLYIALGGNRRGAARRQLNLFLTMLLGGLWHGASWNFVVWGAMHGAYLMVNHAWNNYLKKRDSRLPGLRAYKLASLLLTFFAVVAAWVIFRAETFAGASIIYAASLDVSSWSLSDITSGTDILTQPMFAIAVIAVAALIAFLCPNVQDIFSWLEQETASLKRYYSRYVLLLSAFASLVLVASLASMNRVSEFLYFQF